MIVDISEGNTNNFLVHGVFGILISFAILSIHFLLAIPTLIISIALFSTTNGLQIDTEQKTYKKYASFLNYKFGDWKPLGKIDFIKLVLSIERAKTNQAYIMGERGTSKSMTYDIVLIDEKRNSILLYEFLKYRHGLKAFEALEKTFGIKGQDKIAEKVQQNANSKRR